MKLFEYLATGRPIVVSNTPAIREIVSGNEVLFYEPDDAQSLAQVVQQAVIHGDGLAPQIAAAERLARASSWRARAEHILQFIHENLPASTYV